MTSTAMLARRRRIVLPLAALTAVAAVAALAWMMLGNPAPQAAVAGGDALLWLVPVLLALPAGVALGARLRRRRLRAAAEAEALAVRVAELEQRLARATRQRHEMLEKISHDLRTPLASMQGYLELLLLRHGTLEAAEAQNYLQTAARHAERLSRLVGDLHELTRLEAETVPLQCEPFPVAELAHDVAQRFAAAAARAQVRLEVAVARDQAPVVLAELRLVERVLGNLVENALRHTPAGGLVTIQVEREAEGARVAVADTGEGIASADLAGLFDRYANASRVGDTGSSTAGLGLAIARRIAALHGSSLDVESRPGEGTRVGFRLPLAPTATRHPAPAAPAAHEARQPTGHEEARETTSR
ncbi:MAG: two-component sensor histidine kinase [Rubrivivax sp.]|nr:two-component sensor histidine kinase [Rubrivivax sp.]